MDQHQHQLGAYWKGKLLVPNLDLMSQNLWNWDPGICILTFSTGDSCIQEALVHSTPMTHATLTTEEAFSTVHLFIYLFLMYSLCSYFLNFIIIIIIFYFTILYWFCRTSTCIHHGCTRVPHPEPASLLPPHTIPLGHPSAPAPSFLYPASNLDWRFVSYMILYMF